MKPRLGLTRPTAAPKSHASKAAAKLEEGEARLVVNMPEALHRKLKMRAVERGITIREYVLKLLERDGLRV
jgi:hypothetical protein